MCIRDSPYPTRPRAQQPNPSHGRPNQLPQTLRTSATLLTLQLQTLATKWAWQGKVKGHSGGSANLNEIHDYNTIAHMYTCVNTIMNTKFIVRINIVPKDSEASSHKKKRPCLGNKTLSYDFSHRIDSQHSFGLCMS